MAKNPKAKNKGGRPTLYKEEYNEQAYKLSLMGFTDAELAQYFGIDESTLNLWKTKHPRFIESIKNGKENADTDVAISLYKRAKGYSHSAVKIFNNNGEPLIVEYTEHYPPDTGACAIWLKNRQPRKWRDRLPTGDEESTEETKLTFRKSNG